MEGLKLVKCLIFILSLEKVVGWNNEVLKIVDVVRSHDRPTAVVAKVCWGIGKSNIWLIFDICKFSAY